MRDPTEVGELEGQALFRQEVSPSPAGLVSGHWACLPDNRVRPAWLSGLMGKFRQRYLSNWEVPPAMRPLKRLANYIFASVFDVMASQGINFEVKKWVLGGF